MVAVLTLHAVFTLLRYYNCNTAYQAAPDNGLPSGSQFAPVTVLVPPTAYNSAIRRYAQHLSSSSFRVAPLQIRWSDVDVFTLRTLLFAVPPRGDESLTHAAAGQTPANLHSRYYTLLLL
jgi:hypothetical protein